MTILNNNDNIRFEHKVERMIMIISLDKNKKYLLGVSGGIDSIVLLHLMSVNNYNFGIAHVDHMIRETSSNDSNFVKSLAEKLNVEFHLNEIDITNIATGSIEEVARHVRIDFFKSILKSGGYDAIVLAHHLDDQAETLLLNMFRGSSVHGLGGMNYYNNSTNVYRPLLGYTKQEIKDYAIANNLEWVEDHTNTDTKYDRNYIRNILMVELESRRPNTNKVLARSADYFQCLADYLSMQAQEWLLSEDKKLRVWSETSVFTKAEYLRLHPAMQGEVLAMLWEQTYKNRYKFSTKLVDRCNAWLLDNTKNNSKLWFGEGYWLIHKNGVIYREVT